MTWAQPARLHIAGVASSLGIAAVPYRPWLVPAVGGPTLLSVAGMFFGARAASDPAHKWSKRRRVL